MMKEIFISLILSAVIVADFVVATHHYDNEIDYESLKNLMSSSSNLQNSMKNRQKLDFKFIFDEILSLSSTALTTSSNLMQTTMNRLKSLTSNYQRSDLNDCYDSSFGDQQIDLFNMTLTDVIYEYFMSSNALLQDISSSKNKRELKRRTKILTKNINNLIEAIDECMQKPKNERYRLGITSVSHLSDYEFKSMLNQKLSSKNPYVGLSKHYENDVGDNNNLTSKFNLKGNRVCGRIRKTNRIPKRFSWVDDQKVTPIRNQYKCGSCFIFSGVGTIESQILIKSNGMIHPQDVDISEQAVLDCLDRNTCVRGGFSWFAWESMARNGIMDERDVPYEKHWTGRCYRTKKSKYKIKINDWCSSFDNNDRKIQTLLLKYGPLDGSIAIEDSNKWKYLKSPFKGYCDTKTNHAIILVGWTENYWIIKNSWGPEWGIYGFLFLSRHSNTCGILGEVAMTFIDY